MFESEKYFCVGCSFNKPKRYMDSILGNLGLCKNCAEGVNVTKDMTFGGKEFVSIVVAPFLYSGVIAEAVRAFKFSGQKSYGTFLTALAMRYFKNTDILEDCDLIIPVPLHKNRYDERGYNQSEIIANRLSKDLIKDVDTSSLIRIRDTLHQSALSGYDRIINVKDAFLADASNIIGRKILLVDDIYTMGETANQCAKALKNAGADRISVFALCKTV